MRIKLIARLMVAVLAAALIVVSPAPRAAYADDAVGLGINGIQEMVVDSTHGHLFFSLGRNHSGVLVTDLFGGSQRTISNLPGATGMVLSPDGSTLYVALIEADAVAAIDTATLTEKRRYSTGSFTCPSWLAQAGGKIYFGYGCAGKGMLGSLDLGGATPAVALGLPLEGTWPGPPMVRNRPAKPNLLVVTTSYNVNTTTLGRAVVYDVSSGTPVQVARLSDGICGGITDAVLTPDANRVILACTYLNEPGATYNSPATEHVALSTADLSPAGVFPSGLWPQAVTTAPNGEFVVVGTSDWGTVSNSSTVYVERPDGTLIKRYELPADTHLVRQGLAVGADNSTLYAVTRGPDGLALRLLAGRTKAGSSITLSAPETSPLARKLTVTGKLASVGSSISAPARLRVTRKDAWGTHTLPDVTSTATGTFTFSDAPPVGGYSTYTVAFAGDVVHQGTSRSVSVLVAKLRTNLRVTTNAATYGYGQTATVTAQLGMTFRNRTVCLYAQPQGQPRTKLKCGTVDSYRNQLSATYPMHRNTRFYAHFAGDDRYAPATALRMAYVSGTSATATRTGYRLFFKYPG